ncbi:MAG TPA: hypothetical protein PLM71_07255 [Syntrophorhabdaceae bacterium]|nr:hypothetical protein [Syntrophorhabdaceae bacterium]
MLLENIIDDVNNSSNEQVETQQVAEAPETVEEVVTTETETSQLPEHLQEQKVPYERFKEIIDDNRRLKEQIEILTKLQLGMQQQQPEVKKEEDFNIEIEDEAFITGADVKKLLKMIENKTANEKQEIVQQSQKQLLEQHEAVFRQLNPDYEDAIKAIPTQIALALVNSIQNPAVLVQEAYKLGKAYQLLSQQNKPKAADIAAKVKTQTQTTKTPTLNDVKGASPAKSVQDIVEELWNSL